MLTPGEIMKVLQSKNQMLTIKNDEYKVLIEKRAQAEQDYNVAFAKQLVIERVDGTPITIAKELVKGYSPVAHLKMNYEIKLGVERACLESMKDIREAIGAARSILTWLREEKVNP